MTVMIPPQKSSLAQAKGHFPPLFRGNLSEKLINKYGTLSYKYQALFAIFLKISTIGL